MEVAALQLPNVNSDDLLLLIFLKKESLHLDKKNQKRTCIYKKIKGECFE